jgi:hypothetical protein
MEVICGSALYSNEFRTFQDYPSTALGDTVKMTPTGNVENTCCAIHYFVSCLAAAAWPLTAGAAGGNAGDGFLGSPSAPEWGP